MRTIRTSNLSNDSAISNDTSCGKYLLFTEKTEFSDYKIRLVYSLPEYKLYSAGGHKKPVYLHNIFDWCERNDLGIIEEFKLGLPTLEQVFMKF